MFAYCAPLALNPEELLVAAYADCGAGQVHQDADVAGEVRGARSRIGDLRRVVGDKSAEFRCGSACGACIVF